MDDTKDLNYFKAQLLDVMSKEMDDWVDVYVQLRKAELAKDAHWEPGQHENPGSGVAPHIETGQHEKIDLGPGSHMEPPAPDQAGSSTGIPMNGQPADSTPGGEICPLCNHPDLPGQCTCLSNPRIPSGGNTDGFDRPIPDLGGDAMLGGGTLKMAEFETGGNMRMAEVSKSESLNKVDVHTGAIDGYDMAKPPVVKTMNPVMNTGGSGQSDIGLGMDTQGMGPGADIAMSEKPTKVTKVHRSGNKYRIESGSSGHHVWHEPAPGDLYRVGSGPVSSIKEAHALIDKHHTGKIGSGGFEKAEDMEDTCEKCMKSMRLCKCSFKMSEDGLPAGFSRWHHGQGGGYKKTKKMMKADYDAHMGGKHDDCSKSNMTCSEVVKTDVVMNKEESCPEESSKATEKAEVLEKEHIGFKKLTQKLAGKPGVYNAKGLAAAIGNKKYGKKGMEAKAKAAKSEPLSKPPVSEAQRAAMHMAAKGKSTLGIPKKVGQHYSDSDPGGKLPAHKSELVKDGLSDAVANLKEKNKMLDTANKAREPKFGPKKFTKEEWIDLAAEGEWEKRLTNYPSNLKNTAVPASVDNKGAENRGQGVDCKRVASGNDQMTPEMEKSNFVKAAVPMAKPPTGNPTKVPSSIPKMAAPKMPASPKTPATSTPKLPKAKPLGASIMPGSSVAGMHTKTEPGVNEDKGVPNKEGTKLAAPLTTAKKGEGMGQAFGAPAAGADGMSMGQDVAYNKSELNKVAVPHDKMMAMHANAAAHRAAHPAAADPHVKLPSPHEDEARAQMYSDFMPKPAAPKIPGLKAPPKSFMSKEELGNCPHCKKDEHVGHCANV